MTRFSDDFRALTGFPPLDWQVRLYEGFIAKSVLPAAVDVPTGLGKTMLMTLWLIARARGIRVPRRLVYVVDRRAVVDQATAEAEKLRKALDGEAEHFGKMGEVDRAAALGIVAELKQGLGLGAGKLPISTLRGAFIDNRAWLDDPAGPAIVVGTVDMSGSRLLFGGYGVSRKMRPFHAGLLGVDTLVVLDEAHLVPPFAHLLRAIERDGSLWPRDEADRAVLPPFAVLPLSATQPAEGDAGFGAGRIARAPAFRLTDEDWQGDDIARQRLHAAKRLTLREMDGKGADAQLAAEAWALATEQGPKRIVVFCNRRGGSKSEDGAGPSAEGVRKLLEERIRKDFKGPDDETPAIEMLVGARRVRERERARRELKALKFLGGSDASKRSAFLIATSAGEVGVDIDADHMVADLVPWERMVQRLGRVNRRGERAAEIVVLDGSALEKDEARKARLDATRALLERVVAAEGASAGPLALRRLADDVGAEAIRAASTPEPLRPELNRPLADAWAMTSLEHHTGRPDIAPWLRGWVDEVPQTALAWRRHLPVRAAGDGPAVTVTEIDAFFDAAPIHESEKLETETFRVSEWLEKLFKTPRWRAALNAGGEPTRAEEREDDDHEEGDGEPVDANPPTTPLRRDDVAAFLLGRDGTLVEAFRLGQLAAERKGKDKERFERQMAERTLVLDARIGGLNEAGMLSTTEPGAAEQPAVADSNGDDKAAETWIEAPTEKDENPVPGFQIRGDREPSDKNWLFRSKFLKKAADDESARQWLFIFKWRTVAATEEDRSIVKCQTLPAHSADAEREALALCARLDLPPALHAFMCRILGTAAILHDIGKRRVLWQRAMAGRDYKGEALAKTDGRHANPALLKLGAGTYRHEFGSVIDAAREDRLKDLPPDERDLVLHLIAAHHGFARPVIFPGDPDHPSSVTDETARDVALRFARLQKRWGPWGLAWWESLLRAADQQASRALEKQGGPG